MMIRLQVLAIALASLAFLPVAWSGDQPAAAGGGAVQDISLTLKDALGAGKDMSLFLAVDGGKVVAAFGHARRFNKSPHQLDASALRIGDKQLDGSMTVTIASDGWVPVKGASLVVDVSINASFQDGRVQGAFDLKPRTEGTTVSAVSSGKLDGSLTPVPDPKRVCRLVLNCRSVVRNTEQASRAEGIIVALGVSGGRSFAARMIPLGSITDVGLTATVEKHDVQFDGRRVRGGVTAMVRNREGTDDFTLYVLELEGFAVGGHVSGSVKVTRDGKATGSQSFDGEVVGSLPPPQDALYSVTLHRAIPRHHHMNVLFSVREGKIMGGFAVTPHFNNAIHTVDFSSVRFEGNKLSGSLLVTINPDPWIPLDHKPISCRYEIEGKVQDGEVIGRFDGKCGDASVNGPVEGFLDQKPKLDAIAQLTLKVEDGVFGRAFISMVFEKGKLTTSSIGNNHDRSVKGIVDASDLDYSGEKIRGTIRLRTGHGETGWKAYTCTVDGVLVGLRGAGAVNTVDDETQKAKPSTFWVVLTPVKK